MKNDNELIAKFMGLTKVSVGYFGVKPGDNVFEPETEWQKQNSEWLDKVGLNEVGDYAVNVADDYWIPWEDVKYHESWDWLMPVVDEISKYRLAYPKQSSWVCDCKIVIYRKVLYREIVQFIKWYNSQKS